MQQQQQQQPAFLSVNNLTITLSLYDDWRLSPMIFTAAALKHQHRAAHSMFRGTGVSSDAPLISYHLDFEFVSQ